MITAAPHAQPTGCFAPVEILLYRSGFEILAFYSTTTIFNDDLQSMRESPSNRHIMVPSNFIASKYSQHCEMTLCTKFLAMYKCQMLVRIV